MKPETNATGSKPPFFRRHFSRKSARRALIGLAWLVTIVLLFHAVENWRGRRDWRKARADLLQRSEKIALEDFIPPVIPLDQNFAATPPVQKLFVKSIPNEPIPSEMPEDPFK